VSPDGTEEAATETATPSTGIGAWATVYLKGLAMGAADSVPGVSGGTIALITGIYERLIDALTRLDPGVLRHAPSVHTRSGRQRLWDDLREMDLLFLVVLGLGVITALVGMSRVVHAALVAYRPETFAFFFGLIAASAVVLYDQLSIQTAPQIGAGVVGFVVAFYVTGISSGGALGHSLPILFVAGAVAITAMVLPGISGAFILVLLGQYAYLTGVLSDFVDSLLAVVTGGPTDQLVSLGLQVATFGVGAVIGVLTMAHLIRRALDRYRAATLAFLVSLMVGSLRLPIAEVRTGIEAWTPATAGLIVGVAVVGAAAVVLLDRYTDDLDY
jgi:putative membrane protein